MLGHEGNPTREDVWVLNVDGSSLGNLGRAGIGGVLRYAGGWICGFLGYIGEADSLKAELLALLHGIEVAWDKGARDVLCFSDSSLAVLAVEKGVGQFHVYAPIIQSIRDGIQRDWRFRLAHTLREANQPANWLAKEDAKQNAPWQLLEEAPSSLGIFLHTDGIQVAYPRGM